MEDFLKPAEKKKGVNKVFLVGALFGVIAIGVAIALLSTRPSIEAQTEQILAGAFRDGSPEFAELQKDIIISTADGTVQSPMGTGTISMFIKGRIRNKGTKTITALEVNVGVVTQFEQVIKERRILVVPVQQSSLGPDEIIPITLTLDGFSRDDDRANIRWKVSAIKAAP